MELTVVNLEQIPDDLPPGRYCCRLESMTWQEMKVRFVPGSQHQPGDCLIQLTKAGEPVPVPLTDVPMVCTSCRKPVIAIPQRRCTTWRHADWDDATECGRKRIGGIKAMVAAGAEDASRSLACSVCRDTGIVQCAETNPEDGMYEQACPEKVHDGQPCPCCGGKGYLEGDRCNCGAGPHGYYGMHERYCGLEPCPRGCPFVPPSVPSTP